MELKKICKKKIKFKTSSDTEVLLKILNLYGEKAVNYLDGMWAFAYFDKKNKRMILSRDIFGEKPLYYLENKEKIIFASNLKYVEFNLPKKFTFNLKKLETFLAFGFKAFGNNDQTIFNEVKSLLPGNTIIIDKNNQKNIRICNFLSKKKIKLLI